MFKMIKILEFLSSKNMLPFDSWWRRGLSTAISYGFMKPPYSDAVYLNINCGRINNRRGWLPFCPLCGFPDVQGFPKISQDKCHLLTCWLYWELKAIGDRAEEVWRWEEWWAREYLTLFPPVPFLSQVVEESVSVEVNEWVIFVKHLSWPHWWANRGVGACLVKSSRGLLYVPKIVDGICISAEVV